MRERIKQVLADTFRVPIETIRDDAALNSMPEWDSMGHLELMLAVEMGFGIRISTTDMLELLSLEAIEDFLKSKEETIR